MSAVLISRGAVLTAGNAVVSLFGGPSVTPLGIIIFLDTDMSQQGLRQASVRVVTSTTYDYNSDWSALFDAASIASGAWNGRLLAWINIKLSTSYADLPGAMAAFAANQGATTWSAIGTFDASTSGVSTAILMETGDQILLETGDVLLLEA